MHSLCSVSSLLLYITFTPKNTLHKCSHMIYMRYNLCSKTPRDLANTKGKNKFIFIYFKQPSLAKLLCTFIEWHMNNGPFVFFSKE